MAPARFIRILLLGASLALTLTANALAQGYPVRPIKLVVAYPAGGSADTIAQVMAQKLTEALVQQVIVENRSGASTIIAAVAVANSPSDGYTLFLATPDTLSTNPALHRDLPYDPLTSFAPIGMVAATPLILVAHTSVPANNLTELVALVAAKPERFAFGSFGMGSIAHFAGEMLNSAAGIRMSHVPYRGGAPLMIDLVGGQIPLAIATVVTAAPQIRGGKIKAIAVTGSKRSSFLPDVPTIAESGYPQYDVAAWFALVAPAGTPEPIVKRLRDEVTKMQGMLDVKNKFADLSAEVVIGGG
jgi:tripartite-type tricarboxylate transporter receptor subunit TctC